MKRKVLIIFLAIVLSFAGMSSISASSNLIKTQTKDKVIFIQDNNGKFEYANVTVVLQQDNSKTNWRIITITPDKKK